LTIGNPKIRSKSPPLVQNHVLLTIPVQKTTAMSESEMVIFINFNGYGYCNHMRMLPETVFSIVWLTYVSQNWLFWSYLFVFWLPNLIRLLRDFGYALLKFWVVVIYAVNDCAYDCYYYTIYGIETCFQKLSVSGREFLLFKCNLDYRKK